MEVRVQPYWTVKATMEVCMMLPDVAVMVTFDVPAGVPGVLDPQPAIRPAETMKSRTAPSIRGLASRLRRPMASSDPNGSISTDASIRLPWWPPAPSAART